MEFFTRFLHFAMRGIDILGEDSLARYVTNPLINITTMMLIILGGIGFTVWYDVIDNGKKIWYREIPKKWCFLPDLSYIQR